MHSSFQHCHIRLKQLCSYTTRPRRVKEGDTHIFITPKEVAKYKDEMIAYTKIGEYEYFATSNQLRECDLYVIDYEGIKYMKSLDKDYSDLRFVTIFINTPKHIREKRVMEYRKDDALTFYKRCFNEDIQFREMLVNGDFDYAVSNVNFEKAYETLKRIVTVEKYIN